MRFPSIFRRQTPINFTPQTIAQATFAMVREADKDRTIDMLQTALFDREARDRAELRNAQEQRDELQEAMRMGGSGPWRAPFRAVESADGSVAVQENALPYIAQGAYGDAELMLQNVEWKRRLVAIIYCAINLGAKQ